MKAPKSYVRIAQGPTQYTAIFKVNGSARAVIIKHYAPVPVLFRKGRKLSQ